MQATQEQIQEWKAKYGTVILIETEDGKSAYIFDPISKLSVMKALLSALNKGDAEFVDSLLNNCWIDGDQEIKTNDKIKLGLWDQVKDLIDIPTAHVEHLDGGKAKITVEDKSIIVRLATRQEVKYAEDRNKSSKPLDTQIYLLEKIADPKDLDEWRADNKFYLALIRAVDELKDKTHSSIKKL
jgi:hypothetical protein